MRKDPRASALRRREEHVWEQLVSSQYERIYRLHLRLGPGPDTAADLTQDTFEAAWKAAPQFRGESRPEVWLYGVALNVNRNWWSRRRPEEPLPEEVIQDLPDTEPTAAEVYLLRQQHELVCRAVARLPETYRRALALHYFLEVPAVEIAAAEGVEPGTVRWRLHEGLRRLWILLQPALGKELGQDAPRAGRLRLAP
ncbi:MAG TPA: sigma-70 family RNA polymerase sigma factor [Armatimonadota bacterium]